MSENLWDAEAAGQFLGYSARHFLERVAVLPGFPAAIRIPTPKGGKGQPRWVPEEVRAWALKYQEQAA